jgi:non-specific protein-tyrosine kinase
MTEHALITLSDPLSAAAEAYRNLRASLMHSETGQPASAILLTSAANADGKSSAAANLAITFAQAGHRTILVDADLRKPSLAGLFGVDGNRGLAQLLSEDALMANPPLVATKIEHLSLLPAGTTKSSPSDLFSSARLTDAIGVLRARATFLIFDAPPVLAVSDAALLATALDGVVLVVRAGKTRRDHTERARQALERVGAHVLGAVLTNARPERLTQDYR